VAGHVFITKINTLKEIDKISIVNADRNKNGYKVNNQSIFNDTIQVNPCNFYSCKKLAQELLIHEELLHQVILVFDAMKVSEFEREDGFYKFPVNIYTQKKNWVFIYHGERA
jgi:hypothetical protein